MALKIKKAVREQVYTKIALMGSSGSGKTYSALRLTKGMAEALSEQLGRPAKILMANTEGSRGVYYANEFDYDICDIEAPYSPETYIEVINDAVEAGYDILILDSASPEWDGKGGCLELHAMLGGRQTDWKDISPRHNKFLDTIEKSPIHIVATLKGKDTYEIDKDANGKVSVKKLGLGVRQRDGFEFIFSCTFSIDQKTHIAQAQKDNTHIFEGSAGEILSEDYGKRIIAWANSSEVTPSKNYVVQNTEENKAEQEKLFTETREKIKEIALALNKDGRASDYQKVVELFLPNKKVMDCTVEDLPTMIKILEGLVEITK